MTATRPRTALRWIAAAASVCAALAVAGCSGAVVSRNAYEQSYLPGGYNWALRNRFPHADRLLNAFDYGHAVLYQTLIANSDASERLEGPEFTFITGHLLPHPPNVPLDEAAVGPDYAKLVPELVALFDWAHVFHRQLYDIWSASGATDARRDEQVAAALRYYRSRPDLALSTKPKSMALMEGQSYSLVFRRQDPKFNGLLWSYHWFQLALYDALIVGRTEQELQARVDTVVDRFFDMIANPPSRMPVTMPMAPVAAPRFAGRYPEAAIVFDNLHALHDVVSDILVSPLIRPDQKRAALLAAAAQYRDDTTSVTSIEEWRRMAAMMARPEP
jgi:hypothetical protein